MPTSTHIHNTDHLYSKITEKDELLSILGRELPRLNEEYISVRVFKNADLEPVPIENENGLKKDIHRKKNSKSKNSSGPEVTQQSKASDHEEDDLIYILGYIAKKFQVKYPGMLGGHRLETANDLSSFAEQFSHEGFLMPTVYWEKTGYILEDIFKQNHGDDTFQTCKNVVINLYNIAMKNKAIIESKIPEDVVKSFMKLRTFMRLSHLNAKTMSCDIIHQVIDIVVPTTSKPALTKIGLKRANTATSSKIKVKRVRKSRGKTVKKDE